MARTNDPIPLPEPDRLDGMPHPRETARLFGQERAEADFLAAWNSGRLHHGWLLTGPRGIGKATLAWRIARFLLGTPPLPAVTLDTPADDGLARRLRALAEPRLFLLRRGPTDKGDALSRDITVGEVRRLHGFLGLRAADGGHRVVIVDAADEMNPQAANALLKLLEEPPPATTLLLVAHQPARLLPTIRSRCRMLALTPLTAAPLAAALEQAGVAGAAGDDPAALAELAAGSVGAAIALTAQAGLALYADLVALLSGLPRLNRATVLDLAAAAGARDADLRFALTLDLLDRLLARLARRGATGITPPAAAPGEGALLARLAPDARAARHWAELAQTLGQRARAARAVNLDPAALVMDTLLRIETAAREPGA